MQTVLIAGDGSAHADRAVAYLIGQIQQGGLLSDACAVHLSMCSRTCPVVSVRA